MSVVSELRPQYASEKFYLFLLLFFSAFALLPLVQEPFFLAHDSEFHLIRLIELDKSIRDGEYYARWFPDLVYGYGYPMLNYYSPLTYYISEFFHLIGMDFFNSIKSTFALGFILSGFSMYLFSRELFGREAGLISGVAYIYVPYHIVDIYVRGALPEFFSFAFLPLVLWSFYQLVISERTQYLLISSFSLSGLILTYNLMAWIFSPVVILYGILLTRVLKKSAKKILFAFILALGISAFYWLPAFLEVGFIQLQHLVEVYNYKHHFVYFKQFFSLYWGFGLSRPGPNDGMSFQIGIVYLYMTFGSLYYFFKMEDRVKKLLFAFFYLLILASIFLMLEVSAPFWNLVPFLKVATLPWRFLTLVALSTSFLGGVMLSKYSKIAHMLPVLFIFSSMPYLVVIPLDVGLDDFSVENIRTSGTTTTVGDEFLPVWVKEMPLAPAEEVISPLKTVDAREIMRKANAYEFVIRATKETELQLNIFWFPGWRGYIDGERIELKPSMKKGLIAFRVPEGEHSVLIKFESTIIRQLGWLLTFFSLIFAFLVSSRFYSFPTS